ncbi:MAG: RsmB/NOP family class I SAM-dependent RNA methyltransferase [Clostridia bacterium]|nr:RsmB/NOP family class I SAM-dependent RNA methyltransferase [Clostridia bacterium]
MTNLETLLQSQYSDLSKQILSGLSPERYVTFRVNTLKTTTEHVKEVLTNANIKFSQPKFSETAFIIENASGQDIRNLDIFSRGEIYMQSLSSMLPPIVLNPKAGENILDMAAAPGGKTTQMAVLSQNKAPITACEKNKIRADRLEYNLKLQGASQVFIMRQNALDLNDMFSFDKILLDTPCSGSGTLHSSDEFDLGLLERLVKTQEKLLAKAVRLLKSGGELVYSTCSILKQENEEQLAKVLKNKNMQIVPIDKSQFPDATFLPTTIDGTLCICPDKNFEGFFVAKLKKL